MNALAPTAGQLTWIEMALVIFFAVFILMVIGVLLRRRGHFDHASHIPLDDDARTDTFAHRQDTTP